MQHLGTDPYMYMLAFMLAEAGGVLLVGITLWTASKQFFLNVVCNLCALADGETAVARAATRRSHLHGALCSGCVIRAA